MKNKKIFYTVVSIFLVIAVAVGGTLYYFLGYVPKKNLVESDKSIAEMSFEEEMKNIPIMSNTWENAQPQTIVYSLIRKHFEKELPEGKTKKKAIVIGYDGCRTDCLRLVTSGGKSAILNLCQSGGQAVFSYCGGVNYPEKNTQDTSTAPGWCSMLTGFWADTHNVYKNGQPKELDPRTLLLELVENQKAESSAFYVSWAGHFSRKNATYINEKGYAEENGINATFKRSFGDKGTKKSILKDLEQENCSDFIFSTLEYTDHAGHNSGFSLQNINYVAAFRNAEATAVEIISAIVNRPTYSEEDWLILITTDHGGIDKDHGGSSMEERITFIVSNKQILN